MRFKHLILFLIIIITPVLLSAQENGRTLPPNYRTIARFIKSPSSPYFLDSLEARFHRCDTTLTVDDMRCIYYSRAVSTLSDAHRVYTLRSSRFGHQSPQANTAWTQYQMLVTAIWSTGDGTKKKPLHVVCREDAELATMGYDMPLWFKIKGIRKFSVDPR